MSAILRRFADLALAGDVPFPDLPEAAGPADITIRRAPIPPGSWTPLQTWQADDGPTWLAIDASPGWYRLRFPELHCAVARDGSTIVCEMPPSLPETSVAHLLLHQVVPLAASRRGRVVLHACGVQAGEGAIALVGPSGAGKSTLAAAFCARGLALVADDALVVEVMEPGARVWPTADGLRLWDDMAEGLASSSTEPPPHRGAKHRLRARLARDPLPLTRLILIGDTSDADVALEPVRASAIRIDLLSHLFRLDISDPGESRRLFEAVNAMAEIVPARRLVYPDGVAFLDRAIDAVLADVC